MAYIEERKKVDGRSNFRVQIRRKGFALQCATFETLDEAESWAKTIESSMRDDTFSELVQEQTRPLAELIDRYLKTVMPTKPKSARAQTPQLLWWKDRLGDVPLCRLSPGMIGEQRDILLSEINPKTGQPRSPATVVRYLAALSHALSVACTEWGWMQSSPMNRVRKPKESRGRVRFLNQEELSRLLSACRTSDSRYLYPVVILAVSTGMRLGEIMNLTWQDIDINKGRITLDDTKNGDRRAVPLCGHALDVFRQMRDQKPQTTGLVFVGRKLDNPINLSYHWKRALSQSGITDFRFHDLRHTCASYLLMNGATIGEIAEVLGHKSLQMVKRYAHMSESHAAKVVERMNLSVFSPATF